MASIIDANGIIVGEVLGLTLRPRLTLVLPIGVSAAAMADLGTGRLSGVGAVLYSESADFSAPLYVEPADAGLLLENGGFYAVVPGATLARITARTRRSVEDHDPVAFGEAPMTALRVERVELVLHAPPLRIAR